MGNCVCMNTKNIRQNYININNLGISDSNERICNSTLLDYKSRNKNLNITSPNYNKSTENFTNDNSSYELKMLKEINFVRTNPKDYAIKLKELTQFIIKEGDYEYLIPKNSKYNEKILLKTGSKLFYDTIEYLNKLEPIKELEWKEELKIKFEENNLLEKNQLSSESQDNILSSESIGKLVLNKRLELLQKYKKCFFNIDIFQDPILSVVFQITDEAFHQERRNAILNNEFTFFAINAIEDNRKNFISICSFTS